MESKESQIPNTTLGKKKKKEEKYVAGLTLLVFRIYYKATVVMRLWHPLKLRHRDQRDRRRVPG